MVWGASQDEFSAWRDFQTNSWDCCLSLASDLPGTEPRAQGCRWGKGVDNRQHQTEQTCKEDCRLFLDLDFSDLKRRKRYQVGKMARLMKVLIGIAWQPELHHGAHMVGGENQFLHVDKLSFDVTLTVVHPSSQM